MNGVFRAIPTGVLALAVAGAGLSNVLVAQAAENTPPEITSITLTPSGVNEGDAAVRLDVLFTDPDVDVESVSVFWADGWTDGATLAAGERSFFFTHRYVDDAPSGTPVDAMPTIVVIEDSAHAVARGTVSLTVNNVAPVMTSFTVTPDTLLVDQRATVRGAFVDPSGGDSYTLEINWGDRSTNDVTSFGSRSRTFTLSHVYAFRGTFGITATLTDDDGGVDRETASIVVTAPNTPPSALEVSAGAAFEGDTATLAARFVDPDLGDTHTASLDWGDETAPETLPVAAGARSFSPTHVYRDSGVYNATVSVGDGAARTSTVAVVVNVANVAPTITAMDLSASSIVEQESVTVGVTFTDPSSSDLFTVTIDWGDDSSWSIDLAHDAWFASASHQYLVAGPFAITATVSDREGGVSRATKMLEVRARNRAPSELVLDSTVQDKGTPATLAGSFTDLDTSDAHTVAIDWGDGSTDTLQLGAGDQSFSVAHTYAKRGTYHVNVTVTDGAGLAVSAAMDVTAQKKVGKDEEYAGRSRDDREQDDHAGGDEQHDDRSDSANARGDNSHRADRRD